MITSGEAAPPIVLVNQRSEPVALADHRGHRVLVYFYPRADTPGCTQQACGLRDIAGQVGDTAIIGISPDKPAALKRFDDKHELGFTLLSDPDHVAAQAYDVWQLKTMYGKSAYGVVRSAFLIGPDGIVEQAWPKISPKDTPVKLLDALDGGSGLAR
jgi:peroxiredoxin Q/BCP